MTPARSYPKYVRGGVAQLFLVTEQLRGWRHVTVGARRTRLEFAQCVKALVDVHDKDFERIVLVMDQLNTHSMASLYTAFPPAEVRRLAAKLEIHHTPKHGSWLNMAELESSVIARQCLGPTPARRSDHGGHRDRLGRAPQCRDSQHRLAPHHLRRPDQVATSLPGI